MACWSMAENARLTPLWTQDQAIAYEAARDCIREVVAIYLSDLDQLERQANSDFDQIGVLKRSVEICWHWANELSVTDDEQVALARREFGKVIEQWRTAEGLDASAVNPETQASAAAHLRNLGVDV